MHTDGVTPISIIIPAFNQLDFCRACVASLQRCTTRPYRLILVDNGSTDGVGPFFDSVPEAEAVHAAGNRGFAAGVNLGLTRAEGHVVLLNSDTLLSPEWLERLERALLNGEDIGMAGPMSNCAAGAQQIDGLALRTEEQIDAFSRELAIRKSGTVRPVTRLVGFCLMIREAVWREIGPFDERFGIGNYEDDDYCARVRRAGYRLVVAEDAFVFHHGGRTFAGMGLEGAAFNQLLEENRRRYMQKWDVQVPAPSPARRAEQLNGRAQEALGHGRTQEAVQLLRAAIEADPSAPANYNDLGAVLWKLQQPEVAYGLFLEALKRDGSYAPAIENAESAATRLGKPDEFRNWLRRQQEETS